MASEDTGKSSMSIRGSQGRRHLPSNETYWYKVCIKRISLILPLRMQERASRAPGAAKVARGGNHWLVTRLMVYDLPGCLWFGL